MPFADPEKRKAASSRSKKRRRERQPEVVRALDRKQKYRQRGEPDPQSVGQDRELYLSDEKIRAAVDLRTVAAYASTPWGGIQVKMPKRLRRTDLPKPLSPQEWARKPKPPSFRSLAEAKRTEDAATLALLSEEARKAQAARMSDDARKEAALRQRGWVPPKGEDDEEDEYDLDLGPDPNDDPGPYNPPY